jgi:hypothetical protein
MLDQVGAAKHCRYPDEAGDDRANREHLQWNRHRLG